jgi:hypothetical protein
VNTKRTISARETYILDEDTLEELDELSLTGVMRDVTESIRNLEIEQEADRPEADQDDPGLDLGCLVPED